jgi:Papain family cysteine protease
VKAWGILSPNHETHMELAIRYIGPISVGFNGADPSFLSYKHGIYHKANCHQSANHALLIVGYGQEEQIESKIIHHHKKRGSYHVKNETVLKRYWIARNSWGTGWGENGYVRILRGNGKKGTEGVCGIARSPSVALGGVLLKRLNHILPPLDAYHFYHNVNNNNQQNRNTNNGMDTESRLNLNESNFVVDGTRAGGSFGGVEDGNSSSNSGDSADTRLFLREVNPDVRLLDPPPSLVHQMCDGIGWTEPTSFCQTSASWLESHVLISVCLLIFIVNFIVIWPLTRDCRKRRARHLKRLQQQQQQQQQLHEKSLYIVGEGEVEQLLRTTGSANNNDIGLDKHSNFLVITETRCDVDYEPNRAVLTEGSPFLTQNRDVTYGTSTSNNDRPNVAAKPMEHVYFSS